MGLPGRGVIGMDGQDGQDCGYVGGTGLRLRLTMVEMGEGRGQGGSVIGQGQRAGRKDWGWLARIFLTGMDRMHGIYRMILDWRIGGGMQGGFRGMGDGLVGGWIFLTGMDRMHGIYRMILDWRIGDKLCRGPRPWADGGEVDKLFTLTPALSHQGRGDKLSLWLSTGTAWAGDPAASWAGD